MEHKIRWCDAATKGPGWYKLKEVEGHHGKRAFYVKLTAKCCPICGREFQDPNDTAYPSIHHPRPDTWLALAGAERGKMRAAGDAAALLATPQDSDFVQERDS